MNPEVATALITLLSGLAIGLVAGGGSVLLLIGRVKNDPALLAAIEGLATQWPPEVKDVLLKLSPALKDGAAIIDEVLDDVPAGSKPKA